MSAESPRKGKAREDHGHAPGHSHGHAQGHGHGTAAGEGAPMARAFDEEMLASLSDPGRLTLLPPEAIWAVLAAHAPRPLRVLVDLGTGIGFFAIPFSRHMADGLLYACDVSAEAMVNLREAVRREGAHNIVPVRTEPVRVPLPDCLADAVVMINVHHHLESRAGTLAECRRLLKPGGLLAVIDWRPIETEKGPPMEHRFAPSAVRAELAAAGFPDVAEHDIMREHWYLTARKAA